MLYDWYQNNRDLLKPVSSFFQWATLWHSHPSSLLAYSPYSKQVAAACDVLYRLTRTYEKPEFGIKTVTVKTATGDVAVDIQEDLVMAKPFCRLLHFKKQSFNQTQPAVLVFAPLSGHHATLLRDTVKTLLVDHDVYITDWVDARMVSVDEGSFDLSDYVGYVQLFIKTLIKKHDKLHCVSVCQPTVPVLAGVSLMAARDDTLPVSLVLMGGPIDARKSPTAVNDLATQKSLSWFKNNLIYSVPDQYPGAGRLVYPGFLQHAGFVSMNPSRHMESHWEYYEDLLKGDEEDVRAHRDFYDEYNAVLDLSAEFYLETIKVVFQDYALPLGKWVVKGEKVDPSKIKNMALLTIEGELDDISGSGQTQAAHGLCANIPAQKKHHLTIEKCGHYGIFSGRKWREIIYPQLKSFIGQHQD